MTRLSTGYTFLNIQEHSRYIRENIEKLIDNNNRTEIVNQSLNQTLNRTAVTSITTMVVVVVLYFYYII